jgi:hypothetical protein
MTSKFIYYVYAYFRSKDSKTAKAGTPYYIGKGSGKRAWQKHGQLRLPRDKRDIVILESNLSEIGALALERRLINWYGKKVDNTGILHNIQDGGEGGNGQSWNIEQKIKQAKTISEMAFYHNPKTLEEKRFKPNDTIPNGFILGRVKTKGNKNGRYGTKISKNYLTGETTIINQFDEQPIYSGTNSSKFAIIYNGAVTFSSKSIIDSILTANVMRTIMRAYIKFGDNFENQKIPHSFIAKEQRGFFNNFVKYGDIGIKILSIDNFFKLTNYSQFKWIG